MTSILSRAISNVACGKWLSKNPNYKSNGDTDDDCKNDDEDNDDDCEDDDDYNDGRHVRSWHLARILRC